MTADRPTGDDLVEMLAALANPIRLRIIAQLTSGRDYVSHLAREIGISRPLLHMHLQRLEVALLRRELRVCALLRLDLRRARLRRANLGVERPLIIRLPLPLFGDAPLLLLR